MASRPDRFFIRVDPDASDEELGRLADAALDRLFGPVNDLTDEPEPSHRPFAYSTHPVDLTSPIQILRANH